MSSHVLGLLAAACCGLFAGAALSINLVEHPARMSGGVDLALREWVPSYARAAIMQASLALVGGLTGICAWMLSGGAASLAGALWLLAVVPCTVLVVSPTNRRLHQLHAKNEIGAPRPCSGGGTRCTR